MNIWNIETKFAKLRKCLTKLGKNVECWAVQKRVNLVDLAKSFQTSIAFQTRVYVYLLFNLLANFGFDTAENEPVKVCQKLVQSYKKKLEQT